MAEAISTLSEALDWAQSGQLTLECFNNRAEHAKPPVRSQTGEKPLDRSLRARRHDAGG